MTNIKTGLGEKQRDGVGWQTVTHGLLTNSNTGWVTNGETELGDQRRHRVGWQTARQGLVTNGDTGLGNKHTGLGDKLRGRVGWQTAMYSSRSLLFVLVWLPSPPPAIWFNCLHAAGVMMQLGPKWQVRPINGRHEALSPLPGLEFSNFALIWTFRSTIEEG